MPDRILIARPPRARCARRASRGAVATAAVPGRPRAARRRGGGRRERRPRRHRRLLRGQRGGRTRRLVGELRAARAARGPHRRSVPVGSTRARRRRRGAQAPPAGARDSSTTSACASNVDVAPTSRSARTSATGAPTSRPRSTSSRRRPDVAVVAVSPVYETVAGRRSGAGRLPQRGRRDRHRSRPVAAARASRTRCEAHARRVRKERFGPRTLDVDILLFGDVEMDDPGLTIPHPRMWEREFVLAPLRDVAPDLVPSGRLRSRAGRPNLIGSIGTPAGPVTGGVPEDAVGPEQSPSSRTVALIGPGRAGHDARPGSGRSGLARRRGRGPRARRGLDGAAVACLDTPPSSCREVGRDAATRHHRHT